MIVTRELWERVDRSRRSYPFMSKDTKATAATKAEPKAAKPQTIEDRVAALEEKAAGLEHAFKCHEHTREGIVIQATPPAAPEGGEGGEQKPEGQA